MLPVTRYRLAVSDTSRSIDTKTLPVAGTLRYARVFPAGTQVALVKGNRTDQTLSMLGREPETAWQDDAMERVLGIGGYFMRAADPVALGAWYRDVLGLDADTNGLWRPEAGVTVFATFESGTDYFGSRAQQTMLNFRVRDLGSSSGSPAEPPRRPLWTVSWACGGRAGGPIRCRTGPPGGGATEYRSC